MMSSSDESTNADRMVGRLGAGSRLGCNSDESLISVYPGQVAQLVPDHHPRHDKGRDIGCRKGEPNTPKPVNMRHYYDKWNEKKNLTGEGKKYCGPRLSQSLEQAGPDSLVSDQGKTDDKHANSARSHGYELGIIAEYF